MWEVDRKEGWVPKNWCFWTVVLEKTWESVGQQGDQASQSYRKSTLNIHWKDWWWSSNNTLVTWCEESAHWKRLILRTIKDKRRRGQQRMRWFDSITDSMDMSWTQISDWTTKQPIIVAIYLLYDLPPCSQWFLCINITVLFKWF